MSGIDPTFVTRAHEAREAGFPLVCAACAAGLDRRGNGTHHDGCQLALSALNASIRRGEDAIHLHPDLRPDGIDYPTAAADVIADVMHAVRVEGFDALEVCSRGISTYRGDLEEITPTA